MRCFWGVIGACAWTALAAAGADEAAFTVTAVKVDGNKLLKDSQIRELVGVDLKYRYERYLFDYVLERGIAAVKAAYRDEGYEQVTVRWAFRGVSPKGRKLHIQIDEGPRTTIREISLEGVAPSRYAAVREEVGLDVGKTLSLPGAEGAVRRIERYYLDRGYARVEVKYEVDFDADAVRFVVDEGDVYYIGDTVVIGNDRTRPRIITREVEEALKPDRLYRASKIDAARSHIYRTGLYRDLKIEEVEAEEKGSLLDLLVIVKEDNFRWYKVEPGYESPDRAALTLGWGHNNIMGNNQRLAAETSAAYGVINREYRYAGSLTYTEPWLFGYRYRGVSSVSYKRELWGKIRFWETAVEPRVTKQLSDKLELTGSFAYKRSNLEVPSDAGVSAPTESPRVVTGRQHYGVVGLATTVEGRDDVFNPLAGYYLLGSNEVAGGIIPGTDFYRTVGDARRYIKVTPVATVAARGRYGYARAYAETKDLPYQEKFFAGGAYSVRGFSEKGVGPLTPDGDPLGGNILGIANVELRFQMPFVGGRRVPGINLNLENLWGGLFLDAGNVWNKWEEAKSTGLVYGAGAGLRYNTPVGPLRVDYGRALDAISPGKFYLAFGHVF